MKQKMTGIYSTKYYKKFIIINQCKFESLLGVKRDDWIDAAQLLNKYADDNKNLVRVFHDEDNNINLICVQLHRQKQIYKLYGQIIKLDGTYKTNYLGMPLYTLLVEDNFGVGQPVFYAWMKEENTEKTLH